MNKTLPVAPFSAGEEPVALSGRSIGAREAVLSFVLPREPVVTGLVVDVGVDELGMGAGT